jgi:ribosomal protein L37AE/L43A
VNSTLRRVLAKFWTCPKCGAIYRSPLPLDQAWCTRHAGSDLVKMTGYPEESP